MLNLAERFKWFSKTLFQLNIIITTIVQCRQYNGAQFKNIVEPVCNAFKTKGGEICVLKNYLILCFGTISKKIYEQY